MDKKWIHVSAAAALVLVPSALRAADQENQQAQPGQQVQQGDLIQQNQPGATAGNAGEVLTSGDPAAANEREVTVRGRIMPLREYLGGTGSTGVSPGSQNQVQDRQDRSSTAQPTGTTQSAVPVPQGRGTDLALQDSTETRQDAGGAQPAPQDSEAAGRQEDAATGTEAGGQEWLQAASAIAGTPAHVAQELAQSGALDDRLMERLAGVPEGASEDGVGHELPTEDQQGDRDGQLAHGQTQQRADRQGMMAHGTARAADRMAQATGMGGGPLVIVGQVDGGTGDAQVQTGGNAYLLIFDSAGQDALRRAHAAIASDGSGSLSDGSSSAENDPDRQLVRGAEEITTSPSEQRSPAEDAEPLELAGRDREGATGALGLQRDAHGVVTVTGHLLQQGGIQAIRVSDIEIQPGLSGEALPRSGRQDR